MATKKSGRLFVVNGVFSFIHALAARPTREDEEIHILVLFQYNEEKNEVMERKFKAIRPRAKVKFLTDPSTYIGTFNNCKWLHNFCPDAKEVRMFYTHNHWLHDPIFRAYPQAEIVMFEEGTASFYPGNWERFEARSRISSVCISRYLNLFRPLDSVGREKIFSSPNPKLVRTLLSRLPDKNVKIELFDGPGVILVEQYFHKKGNQVTFGEMVDLYHDAVKQILEKGYKIYYKRHPREEFGIWDALSDRLNDVDLSAIAVIPEEAEVLEAFIEAIAPSAVVGISSTSQLACPELYSIPSFRIQTNIPLKMSIDVDIERHGIVCNHFAISEVIPELSALPNAQDAEKASQVFEIHISEAKANTESPIIASLSQGNFTREYSEIIADLTDPDISVVSFDFFDTLVWRPGLSPSDVFHLLDKSAREELGDFVRFSTLRNNLFGAMRHRDQRQGSEQEEYSLTQLYRFAGEAYGLGSDTVARLCEAEKTLERDLLLPRASAIALYELAKAHGKKVVITSDTYFTEDELKGLCDNLLPFQPDLILSSLDEGVTKRTGRLFEVLVEKLGVPAQSIVHLGDNHQSDVENPKAHGLKSYHFPSAEQCFKKHRLGKVWEGQRLEVGAKLILGLFVGRFFDNPFRQFKDDSHFDRSPFWLGYGAVGPMLFSWVQTVLLEALRNGNDKLLFVARDGWVPLKIAKRLQKTNPEFAGLQCEYVYASRKAYMPLYQTSPLEVAFTRFAHGLDPNTNSVERALRTRFGERILNRFGDYFRACGFDDLSAPIRRDRMDLFNEILATIAEEVRDTQSEKRSVAADYLTQSVGDSKAPAIIDIGYSGSSQRAFIYACNRRVDGYYLTIMEHNVEFSDVLEYAAHDYSREEAFFSNGSFIEYLITPSGLPECIGYARNGKDDVTPVLGSEKLADDVNSKVHDGIEAFLNDVFHIFGKHTSVLLQRPANAVRNLASFVREPGKGDAGMFTNLAHEDEIGAAREELLDYWPAAKTILN